MKILQLEWVRYILIGLIGIAVGAILYPSKTISTEETHKYEQTIAVLKAEKSVIKEFYQDQYSKEVQNKKEHQEESSKKIDFYKEENFKLKQKVSEKRFKIIRPDGTVEEKWFKDSETNIVSSTVTKIKEEFNRKVKSIENKWMSVHIKRVKAIKAEHEKKITSLTTTKEETYKKKKIEINKRYFGISGGLTSKKEYYSNISYDIYGPFFLDLLLMSDRQFDDNRVGFGLGVRF